MLAPRQLQIDGFTHTFQYQYSRKHFASETYMLTSQGNKGVVPEGRGHDSPKGKADPSKFSISSGPLGEHYKVYHSHSNQFIFSILAVLLYIPSNGKGEWDPSKFFDFFGALRENYRVCYPHSINQFVFSILVVVSVVWQ